MQPELEKIYSFSEALPLVDYAKMHGNFNSGQALEYFEQQNGLKRSF